jgi:UDP-2,3-diacylglucosamine pyrophosphatase LpxH
MITQFKTIIISDLHLGTKYSKTKQLIKFLKSNHSETLILNGDIIDGWQLKRKGKWKKKHTRFFKFIMKYLEDKNHKVIYIRGNHDDFLDQFIPFQIANFIIVKDYIYESNNKRYFVCHGDVFDSITTNIKWLSIFGDIGYSTLLYVNELYNGRRIKQGKKYFSLSKYIKKKVKSVVSFIDNFETKLSTIAIKNKCDGIICGHIHSPNNKMIGSIHYLNSGDWVESLTAITEDFNGNWNIHHYKENENPDIES